MEYSSYPSPAQHIKCLKRMGFKVRTVAESGIITAYHPKVDQAFPELPCQLFEIEPTVQGLSVAHNWLAQKAKEADLGNSLSSSRSALQGFVSQC